MQQALPSILVIDDEVRSLESIARAVKQHFDVHTAVDTESARIILQREWIQVVLCDQRMPDTTGVSFLRQLREEYPEIVRMIISGYTDPADLIEAINEAGIYQFIPKPWHPDGLIHELDNAVRLFQLQRKNEQLALELRMRPGSVENSLLEKRQKLQAQYDYDQGIVRSPLSSLNRTCKLMARIAPFDVNVLISGESGTGKELAARALHYNSLRQDQPFVAENCGALPDDLLETELFGHKKGAYTGAIEDRVGLFAAANGGSIFLDEIGDTSLSFQVKLLRVLQEGEVRPMGTNRRQTIDVRVIAATNRNLEEEVRAGRFREDLYYRLAQFTIEMPTLRSRPEDIAPLALHLLEETSRSLGKRVDGFTDEAITCLQGYHWPGNVRELRNEIQRMLVFSDTNTLGAELMSSQVLYATPLEAEPEMDLMAGIEGTLKERVEALEARLLRETLIRNRWNKSRAAEELGLSRVGLRSKLERYGLENTDNSDTQGSPS